MRRSVIAIGIAAAAVKYPATPASFGRATANEFAFAAFRTLDAKRDGSRVLALRIIFAADEIAETALALEKLAFVQGAFFVETDIGLACGARAANQATCGFAVRVAGASEENAEATALDGHFLAAVIAIFDFYFAIVRG